MRKQPFVLRMAGFPFDWLTELADPETAIAADAILSAEREPETDPRRLAEEFRGRYDAALTAERLAVCERFVRDEELRDALFALNPGSSGVIEHWLDRISPDPADWRVKDRTKLDPLTLYLQRVCAKNDSTGHAGPFTVGAFDPEIDGLHWAEVPLRHHVFLSRWAAEAIIDWYTQTRPIPAVATPRRTPGVAIAGRTVDHLSLDPTQQGDINRVVGPRRQSVVLSASDAAVLAQCDGTRTVGEISAAVGTEAGPGVTRLVELGLVIPGPEVPYGVSDPMPILEQLAATEDSPELRELVSGCAQCLRAQAIADRAGRWDALQRLAQLLERTTGTASKRGRGGFYQDRALVYEESVGRLNPLVLGRTITERVREALPLITDTFLFLPRLRHRLDHDVLAEWFADRFPAGTASVNDYLRGFADDEASLTPALDRVEHAMNAWHDRLREAAGAAGPDGPDDDLGRLRKFLAEHGPRLPAVCNIDLMLAAAPGQASLTNPSRLVVGEVHADEELLTHGMFAPFVAAAHPALAEEVLAAYQGLLGDGEILMNATVRYENKTFARDPLRCPDIEAADRSPFGPNLRRQLADLVVCQNLGGLRLAERATDRTVRLITVPLSWLGLPHNPLEIFGFPKRRTGTLFEVRPGETLREVAIGDLVLSRRSWSVEAGHLRARDARDAFLAVRRLRDRLGLFRHVFARTDGEGKPIYVDLDSPLLVRQLTRLAAQANLIRFTEMTPGPTELWLRAGGRSYTSELRFAAFDGRR
ncbi:MAG TPA: hypothetical protein VFQ44_14940 [Streptosporangiaceae bacterium]|nr:hypothetical protein [Streptosporangiaceae bacterium]